MQVVSEANYLAIRSIIYTVSVNHFGQGLFAKANIKQSEEIELNQFLTSS
ncbi:hypothetical protein CRENPOLYSF2_1490008 [Crenothrix polyspora]|uniref:Uncharacterized protein n=1 Tax=Crenothrix polyspora TaxID=360316 RepID=A0A1R4H1N3_9GAMM|nr:hypothetical protein CRENPOLYSF2_1490008 [Crenothrix polyspora]